MISVSNEIKIAGKLKVHELMIPNQRRDVVQPQIIMLESQAKGRHFLHWISPGYSVTFQVRN